MIWAFLLGAYTAGFVIVLLVGTVAHLDIEGVPNAADRRLLLAAALGWPVTVALVCWPDDL